MKNFTLWSYKNDSIEIKADKDIVSLVKNEFHFYLIGNIQPRIFNFEKFKHLSQIELVAFLYLKYYRDFLKFIKGNFLIIISCQNKIEIYNDHFGLNNLYIYQDNNMFAVTNSIINFKELKIELIPDEIALIAKSIIHRVLNGKTLYKNIIKTKPASFILIDNNKLSINEYWSPEELLNTNKEDDSSLDFNFFAYLLKSNFNNFIDYNKPKNNVITLTGGKDSRTGLAVLKAIGTNIIGFTYGNGNSRDAVYAEKLAREIGILHHVFTPPDHENYFEKYFSKIIETGNFDISLHRAHRLYAFDQMCSNVSDNSAYYAGYMAGEFLMGVYYDNLIFANYLTNYWDKTNYLNESQILSNSFHKDISLSNNQIQDFFLDFKTFDKNASKKIRQFYGLFEVGIPHHSQDIFLSSLYFDYVYPFFIDIDFLENLFRSKYNFFYSDNKSKNLVKRYKLYEFNLKIQNILCSEMNSINFGKRGSYNTNEFLKGKYYWSFIKTLRYFLNSEKYAINYEYTLLFREFLLKKLLMLEQDKYNILHSLFDIPEAISSLSHIEGASTEKAMLKYSNIVQLYLQINFYHNYNKK